MTVRHCDRCALPLPDAAQPPRYYETTVDMTTPSLASRVSTRLRVHVQVREGDSTEPDLCDPCKRAIAIAALAPSALEARPS